MKKREKRRTGIQHRFGRASTGTKRESQINNGLRNALRKNLTKLDRTNLTLRRRKNSFFKTVQGLLVKAILFSSSMISKK
jgi:hypothetical protein